MNIINQLMSDSHLALNSIICKIVIKNEPLGSDFDYEYYQACKFIIECALERIDEEISKRMKEQKTSEAEPQSTGTETMKTERYELRRD